MRMLAFIAAPLLLASTLSAAEFESGVPVGERVSSYSCTKVGGIEDGVKVDQSLCYT